MNVLPRRLMEALASRRSLGLLLLAVLLLLRTWDPQPLEELRLRSFDFYQNISPRVSDVRPVVIVDIDEESVRAYGQWPWPRTILADLLTRLYELQAAAIALDVIFPEPDRSSPNEAVAHFRNVDEATRERLLQLPEKAKPVRREGERSGRWVLLDYIDIVVHVQHSEEREFYSLDRLWKDVPRVPFVDRDLLDHDLLDRELA